MVSRNFVLILLLCLLAAAGTGAVEEECTALDGQEANVCGIDWLEQGGSVQFWVTIYDDNTDDHYADWWQVETLDGTRLGRHELNTSFGNETFTTIDTFSIPDSVDEVVVRGHDSVHGYGGRVGLIGFIGTQTIEDQGSDPVDFGGASIQELADEETSDSENGESGNQTVGEIAGQVVGSLRNLPGQGEDVVQWIRDRAMDSGSGRLGFLGVTVLLLLAAGFLMRRR